jgi:hypothetical protein
LDSANLKRAIRARWKSELTDSEIAEEVGMTLPAFLAFAESMGLKDRVPAECYMPSAEEIRLACAKIRSEWTNEEREARLGRRMLEY